MKKPILNNASLLFTLILLLSSGNLMGTIRLSFPFGNNMVLQREMNIPIRGTGDPGEEKNLKLFNTGGQLLLSRSTNGNFFKIDTATFKTETVLIAKIVVGAEVNFLKILNFSSSW